MTKTQLAAWLDCSRRTLSNYVEARVLPSPVRFGRDAAWPRQELLRLPELPPPRTRLQRRQRDAVVACVARECAGEAAGAVESAALPHGIPSGVSVETNRPRSRPEVHAEALALKALALGIGKEIRQEAGTEARDKLWAERKAVHESKEHLEQELVHRFVPGHSADQLIAPYEFLCSPMFAVRSHKSARLEKVDVQLRVNGVPTASCSGPELRQDDAVVHMALVNLAQDFGPGSTVMFSPEDLCMALYGHYNGPNRKRLATSVVRLAQTRVQYPDFSVRLVGRYDQPKRGHWSVALDGDLLRLYAKSRVVRMNLQERLCLGNGLAGWLYGYVSSQTELIPRKLDGLRELCGSEAQPKAFRGALTEALHQLSDAGHIDRGWRIEGSLLRWRKPRVAAPTAQRASSGASARPRQARPNFPDCHVE